jgi:hypothetical protein
LLLCATCKALLYALLFPPTLFFASACVPLHELSQVASVKVIGEIVDPLVRSQCLLWYWSAFGEGFLQ